MPKVRIEGQLSLDGRGFQRTLNKATDQVKASATAMATRLAGAFSVGAITRFAREIIRSGSLLSDMARRADLSTEAFQELQFAALKAGVPMENIVTAFKDLARNRAIALGEGPGGRKTGMFEALGVSRDTLSTAKDLQVVFDQIAETLRTTNLGADKLALLQEVMGESATRLIPLFDLELSKLNQSLRDFGLIISDADIQRLDKMEDSIQGLGMATKNLASQSLAGMLKEFETLGSLMKQFADSAGFDLNDLAKRAGGAAGRTAEAFPRFILPAGTGQAVGNVADMIRRIRGRLGVTTGQGGFGGLPGIMMAVMGQLQPDLFSSITTPGAGGAGGAGQVGGFAPQSDRLARIGGFTGRGNVRAANFQERTAQATEKIAVGVEELNRNVKDFP